MFIRNLFTHCYVSQVFRVFSFIFMVSDLQWAQLCITFSNWSKSYMLINVGDVIWLCYMQIIPVYSTVDIKS